MMGTFNYNVIWGDAHPGLPIVTFFCSNYMSELLSSVHGQGRRLATALKWKLDQKANDGPVGADGNGAEIGAPSNGDGSIDASSADGSEKQVQTEAPGDGNGLNENATTGKGAPSSALLSTQSSLPVVLFVVALTLL